MAAVVPRGEALLPLGLLLCLALVTGWLWQVVESNAVKGGGPVRHDPDLIIEHFAAQQLGPDGGVRYTLGAQKMVHYPDDDTSHFEDVSFASFEPNHPPLTVHAEYAVRYGAADEVVLTGKVVVTRQPTADTDGIIVHTEYLKVFPERGQGMTDRPVQVDMGRSQLNALGMVIDNKNRTAEFTHSRLIYNGPR